MQGIKLKIVFTNLYIGIMQIDLFKIGLFKKKIYNN